MHRHHIIPRHMGGSDDPENLTPPISIEMHALMHKDLWDELGCIEDYIAWKTLSGRMTCEEARLAAAKAAQQKSEKYKASCRERGKMLRAFSTKESCSAGGRAASPKLVEWQKTNRHQFLQKCSEIGRASAERQCIPHLYFGIQYQSKKALQLAIGLSNTGFYNKLRRGEIKRLQENL